MGTMTKTSFGDQLQHMWRTRPVRLPRQGPIAGVAAGFGRRYNVDPVLVRVAFVVSAIFGGAGVVLYLLAWLLCSEAGDQASAAESLVGKGHSSQSQTKTIVLIVALAIAVSTMGPVGVGLGGSGLISLALMLAGWWMLHLRNPAAPPGTTSEFSGLMTDDGITATGYPGATFPPGAPRTAGAMYVPPTSVYTPYTKLPDAYVPDAPAPETASPQPDSPVAAEAPTAVLRVDEQSTTIIDLEKPATPGEDSTVALDKPNTPVESADDIQDAEIVPDPAPALRKDAPAERLDTGTPSGASRSVTLDRPAPPSWDPLGVAPLAWDLPEPTPVCTVVAPPPKRPRSRLTPVVIGLAILAAAGAGALAASGVEWMTPGRIAAVALAVVGLGLVLGAFLRRGYGLLVLTAPLAGFVLLASAIGPVELDRAAMGEHVWTPTSIDQLDAKYRINMGAGKLDLRSLNLTANRTVDISVRMGDFQVLVPAGMTVRTNCDVAMGDCVNGITGPNTPDTPVLDLRVDVRAGSMAVQRG
ncbi:PspC domain-containing protein [Nocardia brasiliensis]|uniref:PspC domain-containing protein n=1 Tax=Nocardia brasiliensis TaxID=37326 RepID=UPI00189560F0|nr:PspC domain-containing protein [Nocardia brasiliensis]MBF6125271.1 PspC domain-containing protein [Nocardia brasiliensis]